MLKRPLRYSKSFIEYLRNQREIVELIRASPTDTDQLKASKKRELANALYRGSVVLLSSHLERYLESLAVEAIDAINSAKLNVKRVPETLRLTQIKHLISKAHEAKDITKKSDAIRELISNHEWFLDDTKPCERLSGDYLISGFDNPLPKRIQDLFRYFDISDVVGLAVNLDTSEDRPLIELKVKELVEKRNSIAHTGMTTDLTRVDVVIYLRCSRRLVRGIDVIAGRQIETFVGTWPWK